MPATLSEVAVGVRGVLADGLARTEDELVDALEQRGLDLGEEPEGTIVEVLEGDDLPLVLPLDDGRHALLPALLMGRTFAHRLTAPEIEHGFLDCSPDLEPVSILTDDDTYQRFVDGAELIEALAGRDESLLSGRGIPPDAFGECAWLLEPDALRRLGLAAGDLVGVRVRPDGFELAPVPEAGQAPDIEKRLAQILQELGDGEPEQIDTVVWLACADDPDLFVTPLPPLLEVFAAAGLVWDGDQLGPAGLDFAGWRVGKQLEHIANVHHLDEDAALAVLALSQMHEHVAVLLDHARDAIDAGEELADVVDTGEPDAGGPAPGVAAVTGLDPRLIRDVVRHLADPAVAEAVLTRTIGAGRERAAALGLLAETLESQVPRAARPALHWLRGRAYERLGEIGEAEAAYDAALRLDPSWPPALYEMARIASDRGDAERGLVLLRRADAAPDDPLMVLLQRFRPVERTDIGRNAPCWCGSGRKYKVCHRNRETLPLAERAAWLYQKAGGYLAEGLWQPQLLEVAHLRSRHWDSPDAIWQGVQDPLVCDATLFEGGAFAAFLEERGALLPDDERLLAAQWLLAERSVFEVEAVNPGAGFTARDLRTGDRLEVRERSASRALQAGTLICARLVPAGDTVQCFGGMEPVALHQRDELLELLDDEPGPEELVALLSGRFAPPVLQNTEGHPLVFCDATLYTDDAAALAAALDATYDREEGDHEEGDRGDGERRWFEHVTTHGMERIRATITLDGSEVVVEANSEIRMDHVLDTLRGLQPGLRLRGQGRRPVDDVREAMSRAPGAAPAEILDPAADPDIAAAMEAATRAYERAWLDDSIPALAGATPREAAADPTRRPDLIRLLDSFGPATGPGTMDPERLRSALGL